jgi:hypothetical protein
MAQHQLMTVRVLGPRRELAAGRDAIQILEFGLPRPVRTPAPFQEDDFHAPVRP